MYGRRRLPALPRGEAAVTLIEAIPVRHRITVGAAPHVAPITRNLCSVIGGRTVPPSACVHSRTYHIAVCRFRSGKVQLKGGHRCAGRARGGFAVRSPQKSLAEPRIRQRSQPCRRRKTRACRAARTISSARALKSPPGPAPITTPANGRHTTLQTDLPTPPPNLGDEAKHLAGMSDCLMAGSITPPPSLSLNADSMRHCE